MTRQTLLIASVALGACGPAPFPFIPSNVEGERVTAAAASELIFDADHCGPLAVINTDTKEITCHRPGVFSPSFTYQIEYLPQASGPELALVAAQSIRIGVGAEVQLKGQRPVVLAATQEIRIEGSLTAQDPILYYEGQAGGASEPDANGPGAGQGGGQTALSGTGAGGGSYCGVGGKGGDDTDPVAVGGAGGTVYGTPALIPLLAGSSGGKNGHHSGAGGGAVHLLAGGRVDILGGGVVNMGGRGGGWFGNGGGSGGAVLIEAPTVTISGVVAANGGGGGAGPSAGGEDGEDGLGSGTAAAGGAGGTGGGNGGSGSSSTSIDGAVGLNGTTGGGGGGGAGRIRINTTTLTLAGTLSPAVGACATEGALTEAE